MYTHEAVELCPHCMLEHYEKDWEPSKGYRTICMNCGESILLCDECSHAEDNQGRFCDWERETCKCFRDLKYDNFENAEAIDGAKFDDLNYLRYTER